MEYETLVEMDIAYEEGAYWDVLMPLLNCIREHGGSDMATRCRVADFQQRPYKNSQDLVYSTLSGIDVPATKIFKGTFEAERKIDFNDRNTDVYTVDELFSTVDSYIKADKPEVSYNVDNIHFVGNSFTAYADTTDANEIISTRRDLLLEERNFFIDIRDNYDKTTNNSHSIHVLVRGGSFAENFGSIKNIHTLVNALKDYKTQLSGSKNNDSANSNNSTISDEPNLINDAPYEKTTQTRKDKNQLEFDFDKTNEPVQKPVGEGDNNESKSPVQNELQSDPPLDQIDSKHNELPSQGKVQSKDEIQIYSYFLNSNLPPSFDAWYSIYSFFGKEEEQ